MLILYGIKVCYYFYILWNHFSKVILTTEEVITAIFKVISATTKVILATEEVIIATLNVISATTKVILATAEVITTTLKVTSTTCTNVLCLLGLPYHIYDKGGFLQQHSKQQKPYFVIIFLGGHLGLESGISVDSLK